MFDLEQIMNLTAANAIILNDLKGIAEEAKSHSKLIHKAYHCFGIGQKKIEVWHDPVSVTILNTLLMMEFGKQDTYIRPTMWVLM